MADGCAEIFFHYKGVFDELITDDKIEKSIASGISGPSQKFNRFGINESFGMFGAYLYPFAIPKFFGVPANDISNQTTDFASLFGNDGKYLEEQMMLAKDNQQRAEILSFFLEKRLSKDLPAVPAVFSSIHDIIQSRGLVNIETLANQYFLSTRQFERKFKQFAGFNPKLYSRITRFQAAICQYGNLNKSMTELAYDCGYYDQSHFIHDFKEFSGHHPSKYFSGKAEGTAWKDS